MLEKIGQSIVLKWLKFIKRFRHDHAVIDIFKSLNTAQKVLICMPQNEVELKDANIIIDELLELFLKADCIILTKNSTDQLDIIPATGKILTISPSDLNFLGIPVAAVRHKILGYRFDIAVDLNKNFDFLTTFLCITSKASLKMCFGNELREDFYNFQVRLDPDLSLLSQFQKFVRYLRAGMVNY